MQKKTIIKWALLAMVLLPAACSTPAMTGYLRDLDYEEILAAKPAPELKLKMDDVVAIQVYSVDPDLSAPFNGGGLDASLSSNYLVDPRGNIDFPVLGEIPVEGKTLAQVRREIAAEIARRGYIREPIVKAEITNFTVTIIGNAGPTVMGVPGNSINILQALATVGGIKAEISKIKDKNGEIDYADKDGFSFISMIRLPDFVTEKDVQWAISEATRKKKMDFSQVEFLRYDEGLCVQCMHIGSYDDEPATIKSMVEYARKQGYQIAIDDIRRHHEIYLSDPRKTSAEKVKTVIRYPIK